jgi:hypothetical protein
VEDDKGLDRREWDGDAAYFGDAGTAAACAGDGETAGAVADGEAAATCAGEGADPADGDTIMGGGAAADWGVAATEAAWLDAVAARVRVGVAVPDRALRSGNALGARLGAVGAPDSTICFLVYW